MMHANPQIAHHLEVLRRHSKRKANLVCSIPSKRPSLLLSIDLSISPNGRTTRWKSDEATSTRSPIRSQESRPFSLSILVEACTSVQVTQCSVGIQLNLVVLAAVVEAFYHHLAHRLALDLIQSFRLVLVA